MRKIAALLRILLTASVRYILGGNGAPKGVTSPGGAPRSRSSDQSEYVFRKYILASIIIHIVVIATFSISYSRAIRPAVPVGPYEVSLVEMEEPKPSPPKRTAKKPERTEVKKTVVPKEEKKEEVVKIKPKPKKKPEVKKPQEKPEEKPQEKPETKPPAQENPEPTEDQAAPADSLLAESEDAAPTPSVAGIQIDSPNFNFDYYLTMLQMKIQNNWRVPNGLPASENGIVATVKFTVRTDGTITGVDVEKSSGLRFFDHSALRAVVNSNPAPPLPRAYNEDRLGVHVNFVFKEEAQ